MMMFSRKFSHRAKLLASAAVLSIGIASVALAQTIAGNFEYLGQVIVGGGLQVGKASQAGVVAISNIKLIAPASLTPAATAAAIGTAEQTFTYTGLATGDIVFVNGPAPTSLCPPTHYRVSAANTLAISFTTLTAVACTPAPGVYTAVAIK